MDEIVKATLAWCNKHRVRKGMKPLGDLPKGFIGQCTSCPCGKATGMSVNMDTAYDFDAEGNAISMGRLPTDVAIFVKHFDQGYFPEYIED